MSVRQSCLEKIGNLRRQKKATKETSPTNRLQSYYERQVSKNTEGNLSRRRVEAFLGVCASNCSSERIPSEFIIGGLREIIGRWPREPGVIVQAGFSNTELKHVSRAALRATITDSIIDTETGPETLHNFLQDYVAKVKAQQHDPSHATKELVVLIGALDVAVDCPSVLSFSQFITLTRDLTQLLRSVQASTPQPVPQSYEDLSEVFDASQNYLLQLQERCAKFVLSWSEHAAAMLYSSERGTLWQTISNASKFESEDVLVDSIVWNTVIEHTKVQYELSQYMELSTTSEIVLDNALRSHALALIALREHDDLLLTWITNLLVDLSEADETHLVLATIQVCAALGTRFPIYTTEYITVLLRVIRDVPNSLHINGLTLASFAAKPLLKLLERSSEDALIGTISNLADSLTTAVDAESTPGQVRNHDAGHGYPSSIMSNSIMNDVTSINSVQAIGVLGSECRDSQVSVLALNILLQKAAKSSMAAKRQIVIEVARIALHCSDNDISRVCDFYASLETTTEGREFVDAIIEGRNVLSRALRQTQSATAELYLICLLRAGILMVKSPGELDLNSILSPLSTLLMNGTSYNTGSSFDLKQLFHNFWFTLVLAGYTVNSSKVVDEMSSLKIIARHSPSLALETMTDAFETDLESYPLLKQAHHHDQTRALQLSLENFVPSNTVKARNYSEAVYMSALALLENLKCRAGVATGSLTYYRAATMVQSDIAGLLAAISAQNIRYFLSCIENSHGETSLGRELQALVIGCCDPVLSVRNHAVFIIDQIVSRIPSAFCNSLAISTLLECITLLGWAAYEEFSDKYSPNYEFRSTRTDLCITVSDSYKDRHNNLEAAQRSARKWLSVAMFESAADVRTLLTSYITIAEDHTGSMASDRGKLLAIEMAMRSSAKDQPTDTSTIRDSSDAFLGELTLRHLQATAGSYFPPSADASEESAATLKRSTTLYERSLSRKFIPFSDLREKLCSHVSRILHSDNDDVRILRQLVEIPFNIFSIAAMKLGTSLWARVVTDKPHLETTLLAEISRCWLQTIKHHRGLFSLTVNADDPFSRVMEYAPTDKEAIAKEGKIAKTLLAPHLNVLRFLSGRLATPQSASLEAQKILMQLLRRTMVAMTRLEVCDHIFARELRLRVLTMANHLRNALPVLGLKTIHKQFSTTLYNAALSMFSTSPRWAFGSDVGQMKVDRQLMVAILASIQSDPSYARYTPGGKEQLLIILLEQEISRIDLWLDPMVPKRTTQVDAGLVQSCLASAWQSNPAVAISLAQRFSMPSLYQAIRQYILRRPWQCLKNQYAAEYILGSSLASDAREAFKYLLYWKPVVPISATTYFLPAFRSHPLVLQYAMRSLESHPVEVTFFYVPQIVQVLRHDALGYVKRFIVETAKLSQLFAHQIIWNFDANAYKDEDATIPDSIKPTLDSIKGSMMSNLSGADKVFYETEFRFFGEVTSISGKLKPFIKRTKPEKKAKIDEEMGIIKVEQGVYLPSNPDGQVIDIDRKSGRPLQSHAKAPFMATFIIRKTKQVEAAFEDDLQVENNKDRQSVQQKEDVIEKRQSAIFKVGDDCRQDVLALQLISTFRSIFNSIGLDLYVFPYRVTATAPGCGVIDVLPNSISRDMLGREAVNGLYDYFVTTFGKPDTVAFQQARMNFVKSLAAYSVITYLLQFKDRHNGNIMYDAQGHVLHIDFGFCFDIAPGGITFESAPFKLTTEMVAVMGGSTETQSYRMFQELCIKAFLVARQYSEQIIHLVTLMLDSGLPCFKGQTTITNLRNRFHLDVSEQQASQVMLHLIAQSHQNQRTVAYDMFQKLTNGIPY